MKKTLIAVATLFLVITAIVILGNVITIGEKMTKVFGTPYLEYAFYLLLFVVLMWLVAYPMYRIHTAPEFPILDVDAYDTEAQNASLSVVPSSGATGVSRAATDVAAAPQRGANPPFATEGEGSVVVAKEGVVAKKKSEAQAFKSLYSFARRISSNCYYLPEHYRPKHEEELQQQLAEIHKQRDVVALKDFVQKEVDVRIKCIDRRIMNYGSKVFIVTAISQSDRFDALTTLVLNYRMIDDIIRASGFRPTRAQLIKQYGRILAAAFLSYFVSSSLDSDGVTIALGDSAADSLDGAATDGLADSLDNIDFDIADVDLAAFDLGDVDLSNVDYTKLFKSIKIPGIAINSILDGIANTIMTLRIGYVTKSYLTKGPKALKGKRGAQVRKEAMKNALLNFPKLLRDAPERLGKGAWSKILVLLQKVYKTKEEDATASDKASSEQEQTDGNTSRHHSFFRFFHW